MERESCFNCKNYPVCKVVDEGNKLLRAMAQIHRPEGDNTLHSDIFTFIASKCNIFAKEEDMSRRFPSFDGPALLES